MLETEQRKRKEAEVMAANPKPRSRQLNGSLQDPMARLDRNVRIITGIITVVGIMASTVIRLMEAEREVLKRVHGRDVMVRRQRKKRLQSRKRLAAKKKAATEGAQ
jgi:hypothetical protein